MLAERNGKERRILCVTLGPRWYSKAADIIYGHLRTSGTGKSNEDIFDGQWCGYAVWMYCSIQVVMFDINFSASHVSESRSEPREPVRLRMIHTGVVASEA